uniref:Uncharacterized protein n=1 Tax=Parascaris univalens TaxID=6257 RepID=A0A915AV44_PARUN
SNDAAITSSRMQDFLQRLAISRAVGLNRDIFES